MASYLKLQSNTKEYMSYYQLHKLSRVPGDYLKYQIGENYLFIYSFIFHVYPGIQSRRIGRT